MAVLNTPDQPTHWVCAEGHRFAWGNEDWHAETSQFWDEELGWVPAYCNFEYDDGEPCLDSSSLIPWE